MYCYLLQVFALLYYFLSTFAMRLFFSKKCKKGGYFLVYLYINKQIVYAEILLFFNVPCAENIILTTKHYNL